MILISSELPELLGIADRIYTMFEGQITANIPAVRSKPRGAHAQHDLHQEEGERMSTTANDPAAPKKGGLSDIRKIFGGGQSSLRQFGISSAASSSSS